MKFVKYFDEQCGKKVLMTKQDLIGAVDAFFDDSDPGDKLELELVEMSEEEFNATPEFSGC